MNAAVWLLGCLLVGTGLAGVLIPILPGAVLVLAGLSLIAWVDGFTRVGGWTLAVLALLTVGVYAIDLMASALGAERLGASRRAMIGAALGTVIGIFFGIPGLLLGPFLGAVAGEFTLRRRLSEAGRAGLGAWIGLALGAACKVALIFLMIGIFAAAYLF